MARFCSKCGKELSEGVRFCSGCGAPVAQGAPGGMPGGGQGPSGMPGTAGMPGSAGMSMGGPAGMTAQKNKMLLPMIAAGIVVAIVVLVVAVKLLTGGSGYMKPIKYLEKGFNKRDVRLIQKAFADGGDISPDIFDEFDQFGDIIDYKIKLEVVDKEKLSKREIEDVLVEDFYINEIYAKNASAAYILEVEMTLEMGEYSEDDSQEIPVAKINGKWVIPESLGSFF